MTKINIVILAIALIISLNLVPITQADNGTISDITDHLITNSSNANGDGNQLDANIMSLSDYNYMKSRIIVGSPDGSLTNYQVKFTVHRGSGNDNGQDVYLDGNSLSWPNDIRFTDTNNNLYPYWIESNDTNVATVWVKVDSIPAYPGAKVIALHYGMANDPGASDGTNTFLAFDNFSTNDLGAYWDELLLDGSVAWMPTHQIENGGYHVARSDPGEGGAFLQLKNPLNVPSVSVVTLQFTNWGSLRSPPYSYFSLDDGGATSRYMDYNFGYWAGVLGGFNPNNPSDSLKFEWTDGTSTNNVKIYRNDVIQSMQSVSFNSIMKPTFGLRTAGFEWIYAYYKNFYAYTYTANPPTFPYGWANGPLGYNAPVAGFSSNVTDGYTPLTVQFNDTSTNTPTSWHWDFGDGNTSAQQNLTHTYSAPGTYPVSLTVSNPGGSDSKTISNYIEVAAADTTSIIQFNTTTYTVREDANQLTINVTRTGNTNLAASINYYTTDGSAIQGINYQNTSGTLSFNRGDTSKTFTIPIINDGVYDQQKYFTINLSNPTNAQMGVATSTVDIININMIPLSLTSGYFYDDFESGNLNNWTLNTANNGGSQVIDIVDGKGIGGSKAVEVYQTYDPGWNGDTAISRTIYPVGSAGTGKVTVWFYDDVNVTGTQYVFMTQGSDPIWRINDDKGLAIGTQGTPTYAYMLWTGFPSYATLTDIPRSTGWHNLTMIADGYQVEGYIDGQLLVTTQYFTTFNYIDMGTYWWTGGPGIYYDNVSVTSLDTVKAVADKDTIPVGGASDWIVAQLYYDGLPYLTPNVPVTFSSNNDSVGILPVSKTNVTDSNGEARIPLTSMDSAGIVNVTVTVNLSSSYSITDNVSVSIVPPSFNFSVSSYDAGWSDGNATVTVVKVGQTGLPASVHYSTSNGDALAGMDYTATSGTLTFQPGDTSKSFNVSLLHNPMAMGNKSFNVVLSSATNATLGTPDIASVNIVRASYQYSYNLVPEWNLISVPLNVSDTSVDGFFPAHVRSGIVDVWAWNESVQNWMYYSPSPDPYFASNYPALTLIESGRAYWVEMNKSASFTITGTIPTGAPASPVGLVPSWNFVGPTGLSSSTPAILYPSNVVDVWAWDESAQNWMYYSPSPDPYFASNYPAFSSISTGHGYWVELPS